MDVMSVPPKSMYIYGVSFTPAAQGIVAASRKAKKKYRSGIILRI
jgi:hypothetical protein